MKAAPEEAGFVLIGVKPEESGFTLIELMISLALFALISLAGVALVESLMSIQRGTEGRLARVAEIQRAAFVIDNDIGQVAPGPVEGDSAQLSFSRPVAAIGGIPVRVHYRLVEGSVMRSLDVQGRQINQRVIGGVSALRWRYYAPGLGWTDRWPADPQEQDQWPTAISADIILAGGGIDGSVRRIALLPAQP